MNFYWLLTLLIFNDVCGFKKCPEDCICNLDITNRKQILCNNSFFKSDNINLMDNEIQVVIIKIAYNILAELSTTLQPFKKLEQLKIIDSNLSTLGKYTFWGLPNIKILDLSRNNISIIIEDNFRGQDNLLELDLSKNKIFKIPSNLFHYLKSLKTLRLDDNFLEVLHDRPFFKLTSLQYLNLCGNSLQDLPPEVFKDIQELKILKCRRCQLKNINPQLYNLLHNLYELDLGNNQFKYLLRDEYNDLKKLKILKLDGNQLSVIVDYIFYNQNNLEYLDISHNRLAKITNYAFFNLTNLKYLDLSYNKLTKLEVMSVKPLVKLEILNISGNTALELSEIRPMFQVLQDLSQISLSDMGIMPVGLLMPLGHLETLNLSGNQLDDSSLKILNPIYNLKFLDLSRNQLHGIDYHIALKLIKIHDVRLENNPLVCDKCHMGPIIQQGSKLKWHSQSICFLPERLRGFFINEINYEELDECIEFAVDEDHDAASTSYNFLDQRLGPIIVFGGIVFIITCGITFAIVMCYTKSSFGAGVGGGGEKRFSLIDQTDNINIGKLQNQPISLSTSSGDIRNDEKHNVKFSLETSICTIDEIFIPEPPPPPIVSCLKKSVQFKDD